MVELKNDHFGLKSWQKIVEKLTKVQMPLEELFSLKNYVMFSGENLLNQDPDDRDNGSPLPFFLQNDHFRKFRDLENSTKFVKIWKITKTEWKPYFPVRGTLEHVIIRILYVKSWQIRLFLSIKNVKILWNSQKPEWKSCCFVFLKGIFSSRSMLASGFLRNFVVFLQKTVKNSFCRGTNGSQKTLQKWSKSDDFWGRRYPNLNKYLLIYLE